MRNFIVILMIVLSSAAAKADTMTLVDNSSVNGKVVYLPEKFQLTGRFRESGGYVTRTYQIEREIVSAVRINNNTNNPGPPPPGINKYGVPADRSFQFPSSLETKMARTELSDLGGISSSNSQTENDQLELKDKTSKKGKLTYISEDQVGLDNEHAPIDREQVVYIKVGHKKSTIVSQHKPQRTRHDSKFDGREAAHIPVNLDLHCILRRESFHTHFRTLRDLHFRISDVATFMYPS